jgi:hypothetical protein
MPAAGLLHPFCGGRRKAVSDARTKRFQNAEKRKEEK